jgi:hypothetical protein
VPNNDVGHRRPNERWVAGSRSPRPFVLGRCAVANARGGLRVPSPGPPGRHSASKELTESNHALDGVHAVCGCSLRVHAEGRLRNRLRSRARPDIGARAASPASVLRRNRARGRARPAGVPSVVAPRGGSSAPPLSSSPRSAGGLRAGHHAVEPHRRVPQRSPRERLETKPRWAVRPRAKLPPPPSRLRDPPCRRSCASCDPSRTPRPVCRSNMTFRVGAVHPSFEGRCCKFPLGSAAFWRAHTPNVVGGLRMCPSRAMQRDDRRERSAPRHRSVGWLSDAGGGFDARTKGDAG